jgi:hypothetical protein
MLHFRTEADYPPSDSARIAVRIKVLFALVRAASPG